MNCFYFFDHKIPYIQQNLPVSENRPHLGERTVEVPIAKIWLQKLNPETVVEIGAVMPSYCGAHISGWTHNPISVPHTVIDNYDPYFASIRIDAENYDYKDKNVLSISTIEHIGLIQYHDSGNKTKDSEKAVRVLKKIIKEAKNFLIDWPISYNTILDDFARTLGLPSFMMRQINPDNRWGFFKEIDWTVKYSFPFMWANGIVFFSNDLNWTK